MCAFQYAGFGFDLVGVDISTTATGTTPYLGQLLDFSGSLASLSSGALRTGSFDAGTFEVAAYVPATGTAAAIPAVTLPAGVYNTTYADFTTALLGCFDSSSGCVVTMRTSGHRTGEASCQFGGLIFGASFQFPLNVNLTVAPTSTASGYAYLDWFVTNTATSTDASQSVWTYAIDYTSLSAPVDSAGFFDATMGFPQTTGLPATVAFDVLQAGYFSLKTGGFIGVAVQHQTGLGGSDFGGYNVNTAQNMAFLTDCSVDYCYVGVTTTPNLTPVMELRGQLIAGVGTLIPSFFTLLCVFLVFISA